jgi:hypothetical protein
MAGGVVHANLRMKIGAGEKERRQWGLTFFEGGGDVE